MTEEFGRSIRLFLTDGTPNGVVVAQMPGWTGKLLVGRNAALPDLLARPEVKQPGVYILQGPDLEALGATRVYIGEGEVVAKRLDQQAKDRDFWETACVITVTDESLTKGHIQYLESRLIELATNAQRASLDNGTSPTPEKKPLPEADRADMEYFLHYLGIVLPVVGFDFLKPRPHVPRTSLSPSLKVEASNHLPSESLEAVAWEASPLFELTHRKSGLVARAMEIGGEFVVLEGSQALGGGQKAYTYSDRRNELIVRDILRLEPVSGFYLFSQDVPFSSPSAAASVVLNQSANGRLQWHVAEQGQSYSAWQEQRAKLLTAELLS